MIRYLDGVKWNYQGTSYSVMSDTAGFVMIAGTKNGIDEIVFNGTVQRKADLLKALRKAGHREIAQILNYKHIENSFSSLKAKEQNKLGSLKDRYTSRLKKAKLPENYSVA